MVESQLLLRRASVSDEGGGRHHPHARPLYLLGEILYTHADKRGPSISHPSLARLSPVSLDGLLQLCCMHRGWSESGPKTRPRGSVFICPSLTGRQLKHHPHDLANLPPSVPASVLRHHLDLEDRTPLFPGDDELLRCQPVVPAAAAAR